MKIKAADYVINYLAEQGVREVFSVYGSANGDLIDAFTRTNKIKYVCVMHEQAGGFAAEGYAKVSGNFGVALATSGPGGQNFVTPIGNCFYDSVPCLFITGQIKTQFFRPHEGIRQIGFQETDIVSIVKPITKYAVMIKSPNDVPYELQKAIHIMKTGRPGPVLIDLPIDVQKAEIEISSDRTYYPFQDNDYFFELDMLYNDLCKVKRPVLLIGAGCYKAKDDVLNMASLLGVPVYPTWNAIDIICSDFPYYGGRIGTYGGPGRNFGVQNSDLLIGIGTRLSGRITGGNVRSFARSAKKYLIDIDKEMLQPHYQQCPFDVNWYSDAGYFVREFNKYINNKLLPDFTSWTQKAIAWREKYDTVKPEHFIEQEEKTFVPVHPYGFMQKLSQLCSPKDVIVGDCGGNIVIMNHAFRSKTGQRIITNNGNSPMGFSMAGAIGAWFATKDNGYDIYDCDSNPSFGIHNVICIIGDGGMNMNIQELQTMVNYNVGVKVFIINNNIYGITKAFQEVNFEGRAEACGPKGYAPPNFQKVADAYNISFRHIYFNKGLDEKIKEVLHHEGPVICDVVCPEYHTYEPKVIGWSKPIEDMYPYLPRKEFNQNIILKNS